MTRFGRGGVLAAAWWLALAAPVAGQSAAPRVGAAVRPDTIRVGEPFTLALTVTLSSPGEVRFPAVLELPEALEQRRPVQIRSEAGGTDWRAEYTLSAWKADTHRVAPVEVTLEAPEAEPVALTLAPPEIEIRSVLPDASDELELRDPRGFLRVRTFPWWVVGLLAALAAAAWWLWRRRRPVPRVAIAGGPADRALAELERLRASWRAGQLPPGQFYDRFEGVVRDYVAQTRRWSPGRGLLALGAGSGRLLRSLQRSLVVRFARLDESTSGPETAIDAGEAFVRSDVDSGSRDGGGER